MTEEEREIIIKIYREADRNKTWAGVKGWIYYGVPEYTQKKILALCDKLLESKNEQIV